MKISADTLKKFSGKKTLFVERMALETLEEKPVEVAGSAVRGPNFILN